MKKLILALSLFLSTPALAQNYQATQGAGTTFGTKLVGGVNYPQFTMCDPTTPANCVGVNASGQISALQAGTWTVQPGNTANTTAWLVTGTGGTFPSTQSGTWNINNISGTISLPTGAATSANQSSQITQETAINTILGTQADAACGTATGTCTMAALAKFLNTAATSSTPAGTNIIGRVGIDQTTPGTTNGVVNNAALNATTNIGNVYGASNVTPTDCSGTITTGGTAQNAFTAGSTKHGFTILNFDTTEPLWISFTTTAAANTVASYPIPAATASTFAGAGSFTTPMGFGMNTALSVVAATTGHKWSCTWW